MPITNPHKQAAPTNDTLIQCRPTPEVFNYLFNGVLVGSRGVRQAILCTFLDALFHECKRQNFVPTYDPGNEQRIADLLGRVNFDPVRALLATYPAGASIAPDGTVTAAGPGPKRSKRANGTRRADLAPTLDQKESPLGRHDNGGVDSESRGGPSDSNNAGETVGKA